MYVGDIAAHFRDPVHQQHRSRGRVSSEDTHIEHEQANLDESEDASNSEEETPDTATGVEAALKNHASSFAEIEQDFLTKLNEAKFKTYSSS